MLRPKRLFDGGETPRGGSRGALGHEDQEAFPGGYSMIETTGEVSGMKLTVKHTGVTLTARPWYNKVSLNPGAVFATLRCIHLY
jgi:hypothetical protein